MVRFARTCDVCQERSEEYSKWPSCVECGDDVCPKHMDEGSLDEDTNECMCLHCAKSIEDEVAEYCTSCGDERPCRCDGRWVK